MMLRVGLIGCGFISKKHVKTLARFDTMSLVAVSDIEQEKMKETVSLYKQEKKSHASLSLYENYNQLLEDQSVDLVIISVISGLHAEVAKKVLQSGKHVVVEKPLALSLQETNEIIDLSKRHHKKVFVCHQLRYRPLMKKLKDFIEKGCFGEPYLGVVSLRLNRSEEYYSEADWKGTWEQDGGMLLNQGIHLIDLLIWLMGDIDSVYGEIATNIKNKQTEDVAAGIISFSNHAKGLIEANTITKPKNLGYSLSIFARKGAICIGGEGFNQVEHCYLDDYPELENEFLQVSHKSDEHYLMYQDFHKALTKDQPHLMTADEGKAVLETIFALYQSSKKKEPVHFPVKNFSTLDML